MAEEQKGFEDTLKDITTDLQRILTNRAVVLKGAYERDVILYKVMQSTLEGGAGQQEIRIKKLEEQLAKAQEVVEDNVQTILRLQHRIKELDAEVDSLLEQNERLYFLVPDGAMDIPDSEPFVPVATIPTDEYSVYLANKATGRGMVEYPFNPEGDEENTPVDVSAIYREKYPSVFKPVPYPYTHPIRDIPAGGGRVSKEKAFLDDAFNYGISLEGVNVPIGDWGISY